MGLNVGVQRHCYEAHHFTVKELEDGDPYSVSIVIRMFFVICWTGVRH